MSAPHQKEEQDQKIPLEAPRAPTEEEWAALSPQRRRKVIDDLICSESQEELDAADAMAESNEHNDAKEEIRDTLLNYFERSGRSVYIGAERQVFYPGRKAFIPDIIAVADS